jgi:hypothetical protein
MCQLVGCSYSGRFRFFRSETIKESKIIEAINFLSTSDKTHNINVEKYVIWDSIRVVVRLT